MQRSPRRALGVADRAGQVAVVGDLDQGQATVLLVVGTQPAVVRAAALDRRVELPRHRARLERPPRELVILGVRRDQDLLLLVLGAVLHQVDPPLLEDHLGLDLAQASRAEAVGQLEEDVGSVGHRNRSRGGRRIGGSDPRSRWKRDVQNAIGACHAPGTIVPKRRDASDVSRSESAAIRSPKAPYRRIECSERQSADARRMRRSAWAMRIEAVATTAAFSNESRRGDASRMRVHSPADRGVLKRWIDASS